MKKTMIALAMIITLTTSAFAGDEKIKPEALDAFKSKFTSAQDVSWMADNNYYKATFTFKGAVMFAYYNATAELLGLTRNITSTNLPYYLQSSLNWKYAGYWITDLLEVSNETGFNFYITLQNADQKIV